jgi:glyoxylase-like metal-dependent hydrolase (beta-lactamase superfamily II)
MNKSLWSQSIFHKFIILQVFPQAPPGLLRGAANHCIFEAISLLAYDKLGFLVDSTTVIDLCWAGRPRSIACALLRSQDFAALLDPGPASTLPRLRQQLQHHGLSVSQMNAILLTHIHLDHAAATGALVRENPQLKVYVHTRGVPHLLDPSKLLESASRLWGDELHQLFGDFLPVPAANLHALDGGETLAVGSRQIRVLYTPGHASHHVTYFESEQATAYVGDTAGISVNGHPYILPATPPPDISIELWDASLDAIAALHPQRLFLTHFSYSENPIVHIARYRQCLHRWRDLSASLLASGMDDETAMLRFCEAVAAEAAQFLPPDELSHHVFLGAPNLSWIGLARYLRKRAETRV